MKREVIFILIFILFLINIYPVYADESQQVEKAYSCLETRINQTKCSSLNFEEKVFSYLASQTCGSELSLDNLSNQCWPKSSCKIKSTAQAVLALNKKVNTTKAENWLLSQKAIPTGIDWFLEIEILDAGASSCDITYSGISYKISISENKKISSNAGKYLILAQDNYWLKIDPKIYNSEIKISCDKKFLTTLLFKKQNHPTVHVSEEVHSSGATGETTETVNSFCFANNGVCNYEGSLWAALVLSSLNYDSDVQNFMPYLITMKDEPFNEIYMPEAFLYYLTGKFKSELLLKQKLNAYWEESGNRYYDTALALLPFPSGTYNVISEKKDSIDWLLSVQQQNGCWNNGNIKDTAFILYSIWPKATPLPPGRCDYDSDCLRVLCKERWCEDGKCMYEDVNCKNNDGCCPSACDSSKDNDCVSVTCNSDSECKSSSSDLYCEDNSVYKDIYTYSCNLNTHKCVIKNTEEKKVEDCSDSETCEDGECVDKEEGECGWWNLYKCPTGKKCINNNCVPDGTTIVCINDSQCPAKNYSAPYCDSKDESYRDVYNYFCNTAKGKCEINYDEELVDACSAAEECKDGKCILGRSCGTSNPCEDGFECINKWCVPKGGCEDVNDCAKEKCKTASCTSGTCLYTYVSCGIKNDGCCPPGCNYTKDSDCSVGPECTKDSDCSHYNYNNSYCKTDNNIYNDIYVFTCKNGSCDDTMTEKLVKKCSSTEDCYKGVCYGGGEDECKNNSDCDYPDEICKSGECVNNPDYCEDFWDCDYDEDCVNGKCVPYSCDSDDDCEGGNCSDEGYCEYPKDSDCIDKGYWCVSQTSCDNAGGSIFSNYSCTKDLFKCCSKEPALLTCSEEGGKICLPEEDCFYGVNVQVSNTKAGEKCCVGQAAYCDEKEETNNSYCGDYGVCREYCEDKEEARSYRCDLEGEVCCVKKEDKDEKNRGWILIVLFLILIILSVLGIVFRDKLRVHWIKIKDKFSGKKDKKKPVGAFSPNQQINRTMAPGIPGQGRVLPRRILNPSQTSQMQRPVRRPLPYKPGQHTPQSPSYPSTAEKPSFLTNLMRTTPAVPATKAALPQKTTSVQTEKTTSEKKPEEKKSEEKTKEKPKNAELEEVLKKLKEISNKE